MSTPTPRPRSRVFSLAAAALVSVLVLASCGNDDDGITVGDAQQGVDQSDVDTAQQSLVDAIESLGLSSLATAVAEVDLTDVTGSDGFTFLAPDDRAFTALGADQLADLLSDPERLADTLRNHVIEERLDSASLAGRDTVTTASGSTLDVVTEGDTVMVGGAEVVDADTDAGNGVVHVIDSLILAS